MLPGKSFFITTCLDKGFSSWSCLYIAITMQLGVMLILNLLQTCKSDRVFSKWYVNCNHCKAIFVQFTFTCNIGPLHFKAWYTKKESRPSISMLPMWNKALFCRYCLLNKTLLPSFNLIPQEVNREFCDEVDETKVRLASIKTVPKYSLKHS